MTPSMHLVMVRNPFDRRQRDERCLPLAGELTVARIVAEHLPVSCALQCAIDGVLIPQAAWDSRVLCPGEQLVVMPAVHDGDILRGALMLAVVAFAPVAAGFVNGLVGGAFGAAGGFGMTLLTGGAMVLGSAVVNGLLPPNRPSMPGANDVSQVYGWQQATTQTPGGAIHRVYGRNKLFGNIIAGYLEASGDTGRQQIAHLLIDLGTGPYSALSDFKLNDQPVGYFSGVAITARMGHLNQSPIPAFNDTRINRNIGAKVVKGSPVMRDTVGSDYDALEIVLTCPQGLWHINDAGGMDRLSVFVAVEISADSGNTWQMVEVEARTEMRAIQRWSLGMYGSFSTPGTFWTEISAGSSVRTDHVDGERSGIYFWRWLDTPTPIAVEVFDSITLSGNSQQPIRRTLRIDNLVRGTRYKVRCTNLSDDHTDSRYGDDVYLSEINEVMYDDFQYPRTVLVGVDALATDQISGAIKFSCLADCAIVRVWNGATWVSQFSRNPAWVCWDILTQPVLDDNLNVVRYDGLDPSRLDLPSFVAWANFCDTLVPDGHGGYEARCCFDGVFDTHTSLWEAALEVCATARAQLVIRGTTVAVVVDDVRSAPAQLFTVGNTAVNSFSETFLPMQDRAASIEVGFVNAALDYARDTLTVVNTAISESAAQRTQIAMRGITRASQAWREAFYRLKRNELLKRSANINVDIDSLACTVGDLIWVQSDVTRWGVGGRAASGSTLTTLQLDTSVTLEPGITYELKLRLADDTLITRTITTPPGTVWAVSVSEAFPSVPDVYDVWAIGEVGKAIKEFIVLDIARDGDQRAKLSLLEYNASLYGVDSGLPALPTPDVARSAFPQLSNIRIEEQMALAAGGVIEVHLDIHFDIKDTVRVDVFEDDRLIGSTTTGVFRRNNVSSGALYRFTLRPVSTAGVSPAASWQSVSHSVIGKLAPPLDVSGFMATRNGNDLFFGWTKNPELDVAGYEIRLGSNWDTAVVVGRTPRTAMQAVSPQGGTFLIKAYDTVLPTPNYSVNASQVIISANTNINVILTDDDATYGWPGMLTDMAVGDGGLTLAYANAWADFTQPWDAYGKSWMSESDPLPSGSYITDPHDIGQVLDCNLSITPDLAVIALWQTWSAWTLPWRSYANEFKWFGPVGAITATYEINTSLDGITWTGWQPFSPGLRTMRYYKLRASFSAQPGYQIKLAHFVVSVDVPDRVERFANQSVPQSGLSLAFGQPFNAVSIVKVNLLNGAAGDSFTVSNKTVAGLDVQVYDSALAPKAGTVDVEVIGY